MYPVVGRKRVRPDRGVDVTARHHGVDANGKRVVTTNRGRIVSHGNAVQPAEGNGAFAEGIGFVAETAGVSRQNLSRLINYPEQSTNLETAIKICKALNEPLEKVFTNVN